MRLALEAVNQHPGDRLGNIRFLIERMESQRDDLEKQHNAVADLQEQSRKLEEQLADAVQKEEDIAKAYRMLEAALLPLLEQEAEATREKLKS